MNFSEALEKVNNGGKVFNESWRRALIPALQYLYKSNIDGKIYVKIDDNRDIDYFKSDVLSSNIPKEEWKELNN